MTAESTLIDIKRSETNLYLDNHPPAYAHDGNYQTFYKVKDSNDAGIFLRLYLDGLFVISTVNVTNRLDGFPERFGGTIVLVKTTDLNRFGAEDKVTDCGTVTGNYYLN